MPFQHFPGGGFPCCLFAGFFVKSSVFSKWNAHLIRLRSDDWSGQDRIFHFTALWLSWVVFAVCFGSCHLHWEVLSAQLWWDWLQWASFFRFLLLKSYLAFLSFEAEQWFTPSSEASGFALGKSSFFTVDLDFDTSSAVFFPWVGVGKGFFITMKTSCDHPPLLSSVLSRPFSVPKIPSALFFSPQNYRNILRKYQH